MTCRLVSRILLGPGSKVENDMGGKKQRIG